MDNKKDIVKLAVDYHKGAVENYSTEQAKEALQNALIAANNGKDHIDLRDMRDGKCNGLFAIIEEILKVTVEEDLTGNEFFNQFVEYRNVAEGDKVQFDIEDSNVFTMAELADGTQALRRQRVGGMTSITVPTKVYGVKFYEEMNRLLSGRADINQLISEVQKTVSGRMMDDIYTTWKNITDASLGAGFATTETVAGTYTEDSLMTIVNHVEAASGQKPIIVGTRSALRAIKPTVSGTEVNTDYYENGCIRTWNGVPCLEIPQRHKKGSTEFLMNDKVITVIGTKEKFIKVVREGNPLILSTMPQDNMDLTQEYTYIEQIGTAVVTAGKNTGIGRYTLA